MYCALFYAIKRFLPWVERLVPLCFDLSKRLGLATSPHAQAFLARAARDHGATLFSGRRLRARDRSAAAAVAAAVALRRRAACLPGLCGRCRPAPSRARPGAFVHPFWPSLAALAAATWLLFALVFTCPIGLVAGAGVFLGAALAAVVNAAVVEMDRPAACTVVAVVHGALCALFPLPCSLERRDPGVRAVAARPQRRVRVAR